MSERTKRWGQEKVWDEKKHLQSNNHNIGNKSIPNQKAIRSMNGKKTLTHTPRRNDIASIIGSSLNDYVCLILFYWPFTTNRFVNGVKLTKDVRVVFSAHFHVIGLFSGQSHRADTINGSISLSSSLSFSPCVNCVEDGLSHPKNHIMRDRVNGR